MTTEEVLAELHERTVKAVKVLEGMAAEQPPLSSWRDALTSKAAGVKVVLGYIEEIQREVASGAS